MPKGIKAENVEVGLASVNDLICRLIQRERAALGGMADEALVRDDNTKLRDELTKEEKEKEKNKEPEYRQDLQLDFIVRCCHSLLSISSHLSDMIATIH